MRLCFFALAAAIALPATAQLSVAYEEKALAVSGASPHGDVAWYGIIHGNFGNGEAVRAGAAIERADASGSLRVAVSTPSFQSIWVVVDLRSGNYIISSPPGYRRRQVPIPPGAIEPAGRSLSTGRPMIDAFVARRGAGAWRLHASDGGPGDTDARGGHATIGLQSFRPIGATPPAPRNLVPGDIVVAVDATFMTFWAAELTPAHLPGVANAQ